LIRRMLLPFGFLSHHGLDGFERAIHVLKQFDHFRHFWMSHQRVGNRREGATQGGVLLRWWWQGWPSLASRCKRAKFVVIGFAASFRLVFVSFVFLFVVLLIVALILVIIFIVVQCWVVFQADVDELRRFGIQDVWLPSGVSGSEDRGKSSFCSTFGARQDP
jgi:hypothetical protein